MLPKFILRGEGTVVLDQGAWVTGTLYAAGHLVQNVGGGWICYVPHTAGSTNEPGVGASYTTYWHQVGQDAPAVVYEYSTNGTSWHGTYTEGDLYCRISVDGGGTWTDAIRFKGEKGDKGDQGEPTVWAYEDLTSQVNGSNKTFTLSHTPVGFELLLLNGMKRMYGATRGYTRSGTTITWNSSDSAPQKGDTLEIYYPY